MDFTYTPQEEAFRQEFRAWLEPNLSAHRAQWGEDEDEFTQHPSSPASMAWHKRLDDGGWVGLHWPTEYGGRGATQMEQVIFTEESMRLGAPPERRRDRADCRGRHDSAHHGSGRAAIL